MPKCNDEGFSIVNFFNVGTFRAEDVATLNAIANGTELVPHFTQAECQNFLVNVAQDPDNGWIADKAMDAFVMLLEKKYTDVKFISSLRWRSRYSYFERELATELNSNVGREHIAVLILHNMHWFWVVYNSNPDVNTVFYGDNMNIPCGSKDDIADSLRAMATSLYDHHPHRSKGLSAVKITKIESPNFNDGINCGVYAACTLMLFLETSCNLFAFRTYVGANLISSDKVEFLRYKLAMCIALETLAVQTVIFERVASSEVSTLNLLAHLPSDIQLPIILDVFDPNVIAEIPPIFPEEVSAGWAPCISFSDLELPLGNNEIYSVLLYFIATKSGILLTDLHRAVESRGIDAITVNDFVNNKLRMNDRFEKIPPHMRFVRHQSGMYYATRTIVPYFNEHGWKYSRFDEIKLKKKTVRRLGRRKPTLLLENGNKKKRPYHTLKIGESWSKFIQRLTQDHARPMTTTDMKRVCKEKNYHAETLGMLAEQKFTLRLIQGMDASKRTVKVKRGRAAKKLDAEADPLSELTRLTLPLDISRVVTKEVLYEIIQSMSVSTRMACVEFVNSVNFRAEPLRNGAFVELSDICEFETKFKHDPAHVDMARDIAEQYVDFLLSVINSGEGCLMLVEFIIRAAIVEVKECYDHLRRLLFSDDKVQVNSVTQNHLVGERKRDSSKTKREKPDTSDNCTLFLLPMRYLLYANQVARLETEVISWRNINPYDPVEKRLVCSLKKQYNLFVSDDENYLVLKEPLYYGTLLEMPEADAYSSWFINNFNRRGPANTPIHAYTTTIASTHYLECRANLKAGERIYLDI